MSDIRIVGLPHLQFKRTDDEFSDYVHYMQYYLDNLSNERAGCVSVLFCDCLLSACNT